MSTKPTNFTYIFSLMISFFFSSCSRPDSPSETERGISQASSLSDTLNKPTSDSSPVEMQLKRFVGQTEFLNIENRPLHLPMAFEDSASVAAKRGEGARAIQEADLFKVGVAGSKLLYLISPYRGLQVVDFSAGSNAPKIVGRTEATGNEVLEMYFDQKHMQIIVMERSYDWSAQSGPQGRLVTYSVEDPARPRQLQVIRLKGDIADSRLVGEILYVATSEWRSYQSLGAEGWISSYNLDRGGLTAVTSQALSLPVQSINNLTIIESKSGNTFKYYAILTLAQNRFNWMDRQSTIEVVDISDSKGAIEPLLTVSAKGELRERSSTYVKDGVLIAVSNSWNANDLGVPILNVTVESFKLPNRESKYVSANEAEFRRLWYERQLTMRPGHISPRDYAEQLMIDPEYGLLGIFVRQDDGRITKIFADSSQTVGDSTGLHANLQDIRFVDDSLYVFWVPANQIDPLDVFDISNPSKGVAYLGRTLFEGWMERAIPFAFKGDNYILGLGWIVSTDGAAGTRYPRVMIFKMPKAGSNARQVAIVAQKTLVGQNLFAAFNDQDKTIAVKMQDDGTGYLVFPATTYGESYRSGGKLVSFDLNKPEPQIIEEGGFIEAGSAWLRRIFINDEIAKLQSLTDRTLGTFEIESHQLRPAESVYRAVSLLELARDIRGYAEVTIGKGKAEEKEKEKEKAKTRYGVQLVDGGFDSSIEGETQIRLVPANFADAELPEVIFRRNLKGRYLSHFVDSEARLFVMTARFEMRSVAGADVSSQVFELTRFRWSPDQKGFLDAQVDSVPWEVQEVGYYPSPSPFLYRKSSSLFYPYQPLVPQMIELASGRYAMITGHTLYQIADNGSLALSEAREAASCLPHDVLNPQFFVSASQIYLSYALPYDADDVEFNDMRLIRNQLAEIDSKTMKVDCVGSRNIPGRPLRLLGNTLITDDDRFIGFQGPSPHIYGDPTKLEDETFVNTIQPYDGNSRWPLTQRVLQGLRLESNRATLKDGYKVDQVQDQIITTRSDIYVLENLKDLGTGRIGRLSMNSDQQFQQESWLLPLMPADGLRFLYAFQYNQRDYFVLQNGVQGSVYSSEGSNLRSIAVRRVDVLGQLSKATERFLLPDWVNSADPLRINFNSETGLLSIAQGLWGVRQVQVEKE